MKKLLIALDDSKSSYHAALYGINFAKEIGAKVGIAQIIRYLGSGSYSQRLVTEELEQEDLEEAKIHISKIKELYPDIEIEEFEPIGDPVEEINKVIKDWQADILVIGHQTHNKFINFFGENTQKHIIDNMLIPTVIVPENLTSV